MGRCRVQNRSHPQRRNAREASSTQALSAYLSCATGANAADGVDFKVNGEKFGCIDGDVHLLSPFLMLLTSLALSREQAAQGED